MKYLELCKIKRQIDIENFMTSSTQFETMKTDLFQEAIYSNMRTLCFDVENTLIRKINILDDEELSNLKEVLDSDFHDYLICSKFEPAV